MSEKKFVKKLRTFGMSMKVPLTAIIIGAALIPLFLEAGIMLGTFRQSQLDARFIEIQNQCVILSNKMTRSGYMTAEKKNNASLDSQMQTLSDVYNGRIVIVGSNFRVVTDTFNLATGKYYLSEEVIKCFKGENSSHYNKDMQYFAQTIPVYDTADAKAVSGVIVVTASTENILSLTDKVMGKSHLFLVCMVLLISVLGVAAAHLLLRPFKKLQMSFDRVAQGDLDADITEETYRETRLLSQSVQKSLSKLKAVDQSRQEFVSNVSHELKTPLTVITANTELLQEQYTGISTEADKWLEHILQECREMRFLVENLLLLAKNDALTPKKGTFHLFSLSDLVMEKVLTFEPVFYQEEKQLEYQLDEEVQMLGDPDQVGQLVKALLDNAVKYSLPKGKTVVRLETAGRKRAKLWVNSQGEPIPEEKRSLIFRRFYRGDSARSSCSGYGLGLAIAAETAGKHRAKIGVEYRDGMNCFYLTVRRR